MLKDCMNDCIKEIWRLHEVILCQNMLHVHYIQMVLFKSKVQTHELSIVSVLTRK